MVAIRQRADLDRLVAAGGALAVQVTDAGASSELFGAALLALQARLPGLVVAEIDHREAPELVAMFGIDRAPALVLFRAGVGLFAGPAPATETLLEALLRRALALDMDAVRTEMSRERAAIEGTMSHRACPTSRGGPALS